VGIHLGDPGPVIERAVRPAHTRKGSSTPAARPHRPSVPGDADPGGGDAGDTGTVDPDPIVDLPGGETPSEPMPDPAPVPVTEPGTEPGTDPGSDPGAGMDSGSSGGTGSDAGTGTGVGTGGGGHAGCTWVDSYLRNGHRVSGYWRCW
jgi:hypothetical protein